MTCGYNNIDTYIEYILKIYCIYLTESDITFLIYCICFLVKVDSECAPHSQGKEGSGVWCVGDTGIHW